MKITYETHDLYLYAKNTNLWNRIKIGLAYMLQIRYSGNGIFWEAKKK